MAKVLNGIGNQPILFNNDRVGYHWIFYSLFGEDYWGMALYANGGVGISHHPNDKWNYKENDFMLK